MFQEDLIDKEEQIKRLKKQMEIEFEMTRNFINSFKKSGGEVDQVNPFKHRRLHSLGVEELANAPA